MADESRTILIDVEVEDRDFDKEIGEVNTELKENQALIKELSKDYQTNATEIAKLQAKNRELSSSKKELIKDSKTEGNSLNALRRNLAKLTAERNNLDTSIEGNAERFDQLQKEIGETSESIKGFEEAGGDFRRNVGNYTQGLDQLSGGFISLFRTILANPIGILVSALVGLVAVFKQSQTGAEFFRKTGAFLNAIFGKFSDIVEALGGFLIKAFEDPQQAIKDFGRLIVENMINRFEAVLNIGRSVVDLFKNLFAGEFNKAFESLKNIGSAALTVVTGVDNVAESLISFVKEVNEGANAAATLETQLIANEKALADQEVAVAKSIKTQKELNLTIEDITKSFSERIAAAEEFQRVEAEQIAESIRLQKERLEILIAQNDITNSTEEDLQRVRDAEIVLANLQAQSFERQVTNQNKLNTIRQQAAAEDQKAREERIKDLQDKAAQAAEIEEQSRKEEVKNIEIAAKFKEQSQKQALSDLASVAKEGTLLGKAVALTAITQDTAQAISGLTAASERNPANAVTFGGAGIAQFISGLVRIAANIGQAKQALSKRGGSIGTVSTASAAQPTAQAVGGLAGVNASLLSQFSQPAQAQADQTDATLTALRNFPQMFVAVTDINTAQENRGVKVSEANLG